MISYDELSSRRQTKLVRGMSGCSGKIPLDEVNKIEAQLRMLGAIYEDRNLHAVDIQIVVHQPAIVGGYPNSAVSATHTPTGIRVDCNKYNIQYKNRKMALQMLEYAVFGEEER